MKSLLCKTAFNAFALFLLTQFFSGVTISGGLGSILLAGFVLTILMIFLEPILNLVSLPLSFVTLGLFSFLTHALLFYILTILMPAISIRAFTFPGFSFNGFVIPQIALSVFFAYIVAALTHSLILSFLSWLTK